MRKRLAIIALSLIAITATGVRQGAAEQQSCRELNSYCDTGDQCCSHICTRPTFGHSTCTAS